MRAEVSMHAFRAGAGPEPQGTAESETLTGGNGNDTLLGRGGDDLLEGRGGDDDLTGGSGADTLDGGSGNDYLSGDRSFMPDTDTKPDLLRGGAGDDYFVGGSNDTLLCGSGNDTLWGAASGASIDGGAGDDTFLIGGYGKGGVVQGGAGDDFMQVYGLHGTRIDTGAGNDFVRMVENSDSSRVSITMGAGDDLLLLDGVRHEVDTGSDDDRVAMIEDFFGSSSAVIATGSGNDVVAPGVDPSFAAGVSNLMTVTDFDTRPGSDLIDLADLNAALGLPADADPFASGNARLVARGYDTLLQIDPDASGGSGGFAGVLLLEGVAFDELGPGNFVQAVSLPLAERPGAAPHEAAEGPHEAMPHAWGWGHACDVML